MRRPALALLLASGAAAFALDAPQWPPPADVEARMRELQGVLTSRTSTLQQRDAARTELSALLKSPAAQGHKTPDENKSPAARAAIQPYPRIVKPAEGPIPAPPDLARVEVVVPPKPIVIPQTGAVPSPSGRAAVDPRTGNVLHEAPGGYIDPRTGAFIAR